MKKFLLSLFFTLQLFAAHATDVAFTPPEGWHFADLEQFPDTVKVVVVGEGKSAFPPSMNLTLEPYEGTLEEYLQIVKSINEANGVEWKDLGTIHTQAGDASLSQANTKLHWGDVQLMHAIIVHDGVAYILAAGALKEEFPDHYKDFFAALRSLRFDPS